jgi:hypothetical protein
MRLLKRTLPLLVAVPLLLGTSTAYATSPCPGTGDTGGGTHGCNGPNDNGGSGLPGPGPGGPVR